MTIVRSDSERTRAIATRAEVSRVTADFLLLVASVASLVGVGLILVKAASSDGAAEAALTAVGALSVVLAWAIVHTIYTLRYADIYYRTGGGIDFNEDDEPEYRDFAYLAFTIGMTYQVSDTDLRTKASATRPCATPCSRTCSGRHHRRQHQHRGQPARP
jgi:uncharacterized membrane protein